MPRLGSVARLFTFDDIRRFEAHARRLRALSRSLRVFAYEEDERLQFGARRDDEARSRDRDDWEELRAPRREQGARDKAACGPVPLGERVVAYALARRPNGFRARKAP